MWLFCFVKYTSFAVKSVFTKVSYFFLAGVIINQNQVTKSFVLNFEITILPRKSLITYVDVTDACQSAKEGLLSIKNNHPELVFLDIAMPWMNGFEMLEVISKEINFHIIFTTAYDQFAIKAFKVSAVDYLLKPVDSSDLIAAVNKVKKLLNEDKKVKTIANLFTKYAGTCGASKNCYSQQRRI